jgi:DNA ligase 1
MKRLAAALEATRLTRSRIGKEEAIGEVLAAVANDDPQGIALMTAARITAGMTLGPGDTRPLGVGWSLLGDVMVDAVAWPKWVVWECARRCGELGEAFALLQARLPGVQQRRGISLLEVAALFDALASTGRRELKRARLDEVFARTTPLETKYLAKAFHSSLRVGAQGGVLEGAIARAFKRPLDEVRAAAAIVTDPGVVAVLARDDQLRSARVEIGRPVAYMLATPLETIASAIDPAMHVVEDKIDGVRAQVHKVGDTVSIFARGLERVTDAYPEIVEAFQFVRGSIALDGELVAVTADMRPRPFLALQTRLRRKEPSAELLDEVPVAFFAYDLLADDEGDHLGLPWRERRARLEEWAATSGPRTNFVLNAVRPMGDLDPEFDAARARGHEGLVLKRVDAVYDAGRRGQSWIKVKKAFATLDVVITAAQEGTGKRAGTLSDYTFGVWRDGELVNVGKAYSGVTDEEIVTMTRRLEKLTTEKFGGTRVVRPEIVLEVGFDGIQRSTRHKSGYALRFPRILRIRDDKKPEEADSVTTVEALFNSQLESGHREVETAAERKSKRKGPKNKVAPKKQMSLFGDDDDKR